jgi:hypothetical protein
MYEVNCVTNNAFVKTVTVKIVFTGLQELRTSSSVLAHWEKIVLESH